MRPETKQLLKNISIGLGVFGFVGLLLFGVWEVTRLPMMTISEVEVSGGETISHDRIKADVQQLLEGEYARFVPRRFVWTYPESEIVELVQATPRVKDPVVSRDGKIVTVTFAEYEPVALWCDSTDTNSCVFLDEVGYGFAAAPVLDGGAFVRYVQVGQAADTAAVFTDATDFTQLQELVAGLATFSWLVATIELDQARDAFVKLVGGGELKVSLSLTTAQTIDNLQTVLTAEKYSNLTPDSFSYIDLRFGNKVFVNEFGDPVEQVPEDDGEQKTATSTDVAVDD